ncbi:MAG: efflux RND transporter periplasmic adaptor subunit [Chloroflexi bacterium]|nr:efflux RND transporter periplasmic adaptor subunit [Chloroflexota bacterium]
MKSRFFKIVSLILTLITVSFPGLSCTFFSSKSTPTSQSQVATVQRGDLTLEITASGNLAFSTSRDLNFGIAGTVAEVNVKTSDTVKKEQVLAKLDTTTLDEAVATAQVAVESAQVAVESAQVDIQSANQTYASNVKSNELSIKSAQKSLEEAKQQGGIDIRNAARDVETATNTLSKLSYPYTYSTFTLDVPAAVVAIHDAQLQLRLASESLQPNSINYGAAFNKLQLALDSLQQAQERLLRGQGVENFIATLENRGSSLTDYWTLRDTQMALEKAQSTLADKKVSVQNSIEDAALALEKAQDTLQQTKTSYLTTVAKNNLSLQKAQSDLKKTQSDLKKAQDNLAKAVITAPFDGFITAVNFEGGDQVQVGQTAISLVEQGKFEATLLVNEKDIAKVRLNGKATVQIDALSRTTTLSARVTDISPTATISSGVVNYKVEVEIEPSGGQPGQMSTATETIQLRQGLTVTVNIIVQQKTNVLLVPYAAITSQGGQSYVQVVSATGVLERRAIKTGITDYTNTEVTQGLGEGENVVVPTAAAKSTTTSQQKQPSPPMMIPGMGGPPK